MNIFDILLKKQIKNSTPPKIIEKDGVEYRYVKIKNSKSIKITVTDPFRVKVTLPERCSYKKAQDFVQQKESWIENTLKKYKTNLIEENIKTQSNNFLITTGLVQEPKISKKGNVVIFTYPIGENFNSKEIQDKAKTALKKALHIEAKNYLPKRTEELSTKFGFRYKKIFLKAEKTRWGSCSSLNNINLNINLMLLPYDMIDYVIIHELCHTVEKNHGINFWALVQKCMPEYKKIKKELKEKRLLV